MTSSDDDAGRNDRSDSPAGGSEQSSAGYEAPPIEQSATPPDYTPPPAYNPAPPQYSSPTDYPPPPSGYPPPYPEQNTGPSPYPGAGYGGPSYPPPPPYGTAPGGYPPPPMGGYPNADYGYGVPQAPPGTNTMAIASLVASIVGVCCGIGSIIGIVLGILALNQIKQTRQAGHGLAVAGIAVGAVSLVISLVWNIYVFSS
jgi:uncharacterized protein DUF4190